VVNVIEAKCRKCGDHFVPTEDDLAATFNGGKPLYRHHVRFGNEREGDECGGLGEVIGITASRPAPGLQPDRYHYEYQVLCSDGEARWNVLRSRRSAINQVQSLNAICRELSNQWRHEHTIQRRQVGEWEDWDWKEASSEDGREDWHG
jgi:hypothetical protein